MIAYLAELVARPAAAETLARLLEGLVHSTNSEPGARIYVVHQQADDPARFVVYEAYADAAAGAAHMQGAPVQSALLAFSDLLAQPPALRELGVRGGFARPLDGPLAAGLL